jgi:histone-lysine N-methyltransferase SETMAR
MQNSKHHIRQRLLYEYQLGHSARQAALNICSAKDLGTVHPSTASRWFERFRNGDNSLEDEPRSGRPVEINMDALRQAIESDPTLTTRDVARKLGCTHGTVHYHFKELRLVSKLGDWSPHDLTAAQREKRVAACQQNCSLRRNFNWLDNLITGDEKWVLYINKTRKRQWLPPGAKAQPTPKAGLHPEKRMLCIWWTVQGVVYWELLPNRATVNAARYRIQLNRLAAELQRTRQDRCQIFFQHDNAKPHVAKTIKQKLEQLGWQLISHPPYSPDLAPSDYHLFRSLSNDLRSRKFEDEDALKQYLQEFFDSKPKEFYARGIHDLARRWRQVIESKGAYIN